MTARAAVVAPAVAVILAGVGSAFLARPALVVGLIGGVLLAVGAAAWLRRVRGDLDGDGFGFVIEIAFAAILLVTVVAL